MPKNSIKNDDTFNVIIPNLLYLGNYYAAENADFMKTHKIKAVVNATTDVKCLFEKKPYNIKYFKVELEDSLKKEDIDKMTAIMPKAAEFIHNNIIQGKAVFIHCIAGYNRSSSIVAFYLSKYHNMTLNESINYIIARRKCAFNHGKSVNFEESLRAHTK